jgi:phosphoribosyl-ATP pyrophosphohydrolase/phosphoribosyl-AMP cyclohydrolase/histidinol dehydrogenase
LASLPTAATALAAFCSNGVVALVDDLAQGVSVANRLAPEHLEICVRDGEVVQDRLTAYGSLFVGGQTAEVFGDYGAGPNHVLPTGGGSRFQAGLSVMTYLRPLTFLNVQDPRLIQQDAARLARMEGLEGHARSAQRR